MIGGVRVASLILLLAFCLLCAPACREATQMQVEAYTNLGYDASAALAFFSGRDLASLSRDASSVPPVQWGQDGRLGSLVFVPPSDNPRARVAVRTVLAFGRDPATCSASDAQGCIVADRQLTYDKGTSLRVPVGLFRQCMGVVCPTGLTCNYEGSCVSAEIDVARCSSEAGCFIAGDPPSPPGVSSEPPPIGDASTETSHVAPASPLEPLVAMRDRDPRQGFVEGTLSVSARPGSAPVTRVDLSYPGAAGPFASLRTLPGSYTFLAGSPLPPATDEVIAVAVAEGPHGASSSAAVRVRVDNYPRIKDIGADQGADLAQGARYFADANAPASRLLVFGVDGSSRPTIRRCNIDGSQCEGQLLGGAGTREQAAVSLPLSGVGALVIAQSDGRARSCRADGTGCVDFSYGDVESGSVMLWAHSDPLNKNGYVIVHATSRPTPPSVLSVFRCEAQTCARTQLSIAADFSLTRPAMGSAAVHLTYKKRVGGETGLVSCSLSPLSCVTRPFGVAATPASLAMNGDAPSVVALIGKPSLLDCASMPCTATNLGGASFDPGGSWSPRLTFVAGVPVILYLSSSGKLSAARCPAGNCQVTDLSAFVPVDFDGRSGHVFTDVPGRVVLGGVTYDGVPSMLRCTAAFDACASASVATAELVGNTVGEALDAIVDPAGKRILTITANPARSVRPTLFSCDLDASNCLARDVSASGLAQSGHFPSIASVDKNNLVFVADDRSKLDEEFTAASVFTCDTQGNGCTSRLLFPTTDDAFLWPGTNVVQRLKSGRLRVLHQDEIGSYDVQTLDCAADGTGCLLGALATDSFPLAKVAYDPVTDRSFPTFKLSNDPINGYACTTDPADPGANECEEFDISGQLPEQSYFPELLSVTVESGVPTYLLSFTDFDADPPAFPLALVRCPDLVCAPAELLAVPAAAEPLDATYGRVDMVYDAGRNVRYLLLGGEFVPPTLLRCGAKGCERLHSFGLDYTPPYKLLLDASSDRLFVVFRDDANRGRPAVLTLDLY
jgi:hypothetical protein